MVRFADGDRAAFRAVFDGLWPVLIAFTSRMLAVRADGEDAAQRALLKVFSRIADLDRGRDGVAWAVTIAAFEVMTIRRQHVRRREQSADVLATTADGSALPDEQLARAELGAAVHSAVGELPVRDQLALSAVLDEVAATDETQRKRRFRAVQRLRALWSRVHG